MNKDGWAGSFVALFDLVAHKVHQTARTKGWWDHPRTIAEQIALQHSELSEALEGARHGNPPSDKLASFNALEEEYADVIIRIMDTAVAMNLRLAEALVAKMEYNEGRSYKHGGKLF